MTRRILRSFILLAVVLCQWTAQAPAQSIQERHEIEGRLIDAFGRSVEGVLVQVLWRDLGESGVPVQEAWSDPTGMKATRSGLDGAFRVAVPHELSATYRLMARDPRVGEAVIEWRTDPMELLLDVGEVTIVPTASLEVRFTQVTNDQLTALADWTLAAEWTYGEGGDFSCSMRRTSQFIEAQRSFDLHGIPHGAVDLLARNTTGEFLELGTIHLLPGESRALDVPADFLLSRSGIMVCTTESPIGRGDVPTTLTLFDHNGGRLEMVPLGSGRSVWWLEDPPKDDLEIRATGTCIESRPEQFLRDGDRRFLTTSGTLALNVKVVDAAGDPVELTCVTHQLAGTRALPIGNQIQTGGFSKGSFSLDGLQPGLVTLQITASGWPRFSWQIEVEEGGAEAVECVLPELHCAVGVLRDEQDQCVSGAQVSSHWLATQDEIDRANRFLQQDPAPAIEMPWTESFFDASAKTNERGEFELEGLAPGTHFIVAVVSPRVFSATLVECRSQTLVSRVQIEIVGTRDLELELLLPFGHEPNQFSITLYGEGFDGVRTLARANADGVWSLGRIPGGMVGVKAWPSRWESLGLTSPSLDLGMVDVDILDRGIIELDLRDRLPVVCEVARPQGLDRSSVRIMAHAADLEPQSFREGWGSQGIKLVLVPGNYRLSVECPEAGWSWSHSSEVVVVPDKGLLDRVFPRRQSWPAKFRDEDDGALGRVDVQWRSVGMEGWGRLQKTDDLGVIDLLLPDGQYEFRVQSVSSDPVLVDLPTPDELIIVVPR